MFVYFAVTCFYFDVCWCVLSRVHSCASLSRCIIYFDRSVFDVWRMNVFFLIWASNSTNIARSSQWEKEPILWKDSKLTPSRSPLIGWVLAGCLVYDHCCHRCHRIAALHRRGVASWLADPSSVIAHIVFGFCLNLPLSSKKRNFYDKYGTGSLFTIANPMSIAPTQSFCKHQILGFWIKEWNGIEDNKPLVPCGEKNKTASHSWLYFGIDSSQQMMVAGWLSV